jgi:hypothetical protein
MALITNVPTTPTSFGALTVAQLFTCRSGLVGISTDAGVGDDFFWLSPGEAIQIASGLTVTYRAGEANTVLHQMPMSV